MNYTVAHQQLVTAIVNLKSLGFTAREIRDMVTSIQSLRGDDSPVGGSTSSGKGNAT